MSPPWSEKSPSLQVNNLRGLSKSIRQLQVAQVTQTFTATSEESAAASEELSGQADVLSGMVQQFNLQEN